MNEPQNNNEVIIKIPIALEELILANNELLKNYRAMVMEKIQHANAEMMGILKLSPSAGWKLDIERMVYTRPLSEEELAKK